MAATRRTRRSRFTLALLILTSVTLISLDYGGFGPLESARRAVLSFTSPAREAVGGVLAPVGDLWQGAFGYGDLEAENERLRAELEAERGEAAAQESAARTLELLLDEVDIPFAGSIDTVTARLVGGPVANTGGTIEIDKGSSAGIRGGMAVITSGGLVGSVERAAPRRSAIRVVTDAGFRIGVRIDESLLGVATGQGADEPLLVEMSNDPTRPIEEGMVVTTSGLERSLFPAGIPIGRVVEVSVDEDGLTQILRVEPLADLASLGFLNVMLWEPAQ